MSVVTESSERVIRKDVARNRARLLQAADELVAEHGLEISLNELARRAGLGVGTVYRHFADKDAVLDALFEDRLDIVAQVMQDAAQREDPIEALRYAVFTICELQARDRALFQAVATGKTPEQRAKTRRRLEPLAIKLVERAKATGRMRADFAPTDVPVLLWISMAVSDIGGTVRPDLWRRYVEVALAGFAAEGEPQRAFDVAPFSSDGMEVAMKSRAERQRQ
jgi:AcrR family transcriptional regulator